MTCVIYLQNFVKSSQMVHHNISVFIENGHCDKEVELGGEMVGKQDFPEAHDIDPFKFTLEPN